MKYCLTDNASSSPAYPIGIADIDVGDNPLIQFNASSTQMYLTECENATTSIAVSVDNATVDNPTFDLFMGFILFYMVLAGVVWFFRKKS